ncbi:unnamed protein product [Angiostrongylus costaricensis]|uniref:TPX2 domain-containing protein n=1 Tax=Angiostrongylus costaricensis TaxID=334426 RepID=A0A0R3PAT6_ANGCS|nr:unnamed protein product [Angiostrongylus costaricensis]
MLASVSNPREVFRSDEFLVQLAQPTNVRFSLYEHAPLTERQEKFQEAIAQRKLALVELENYKKCSERSIKPHNAEGFCFPLLLV